MSPKQPLLWRRQSEPHTGAIHNTLYLNSCTKCDKSKTDQESKSECMYMTEAPVFCNFVHVLQRFLQAVSSVLSPLLLDFLYKNGHVIRGVISPSNLQMHHGKGSSSFAIPQNHHQRVKWAAPHVKKNNTIISSLSVLGPLPVVRPKVQPSKALALQSNPRLGLSCHWPARRGRSDCTGWTLSSWQTQPRLHSHSISRSVGWRRRRRSMGRGRDGEVGTWQEQRSD